MRLEELVPTNNIVKNGKIREESNSIMSTETNTKDQDSGMFVK